MAIGTFEEIRREKKALSFEELRQAPDFEEIQETVPQQTPISVEPSEEDLKKYRKLGVKQYRSPSGKLYDIAPTQFDPEGYDYDYETAKAHDLQPDETGHWPSRVPQTGQILKGRKHQTYNQTLEGEKEAGYVITKGQDGRYYSRAKSTSGPPATQDFPLGGAYPEPFITSFKKGVYRATHIPKLMGKEIPEPVTTVEKAGDLTGQIAENIAEIYATYGVLTTAKLLPTGISFLHRAAQLAVLFGTQQATEEIRKGVAEQLHDEDYGYEGATGVLESMAVGAIVSMAHSGVKGIWSRLKPTEQSRALKLLGLKKGATEQQIKKAVRRQAIKYHPDKVKGMEEKFKKVMDARDTLRKGEFRDIIYRGQKPKPPAQITGEVTTIGATTPTEPLAAKRPVPEGVTTPQAPEIKAGGKEPWEMTIKEYDHLRKNINAAFLLKDGRVIDTGAIHHLPKGIKSEDVLDSGFIRSDTGEFLTQKQTLELIGFDSTRHLKDVEEPPDIRHKLDVQEALKQGKPVPAEVLAEYPDLAAPTAEGKAKDAVKAFIKNSYMQPDIYDLGMEEGLEYENFVQRGVLTKEQVERIRDFLQTFQSVEDSYTIRDMGRYEPGSRELYEKQVGKLADLAEKYVFGDIKALPAVKAKALPTPTAEVIEPVEPSLLKKAVTVSERKFHPVRLPTGAIGVDAERFQFKLGARLTGGVTEALKEVEKYDPIKAGIILAWQDKSGKHWVIDGHHRVALARKTGQPELQAWVVREEDGWSAEEARAVGALRNLADGKGTAIDAAKLFRDSNISLAELRKEGVPTNNTVVQQGMDMKKLSDDVFRLVIDERLPANMAAAIGKNAKGDTQQKQVADLILEGEVDSVRQAELLSMTIDSAPVLTKSEQTLFGLETSEKSLYAERAKVLANVEKKLKTNKKVFGTLAKQSGLIEAKGNILAKVANLEAKELAEEVLYLLEKFANAKGEVAEALNDATKKYAENPTSENLSKITNELVQKWTEATTGLSVQNVKGLFGPPAKRAEPEIEAPKIVPVAKKPSVEGKAKEIFNQIQKLEQANRNTIRLSAKRGYGWGSDVMEAREKKIKKLHTQLDELGYVYRPRVRTGKVDLITKAQHKQEIEAHIKHREIVEELETKKPTPTPKAKEPWEMSREEYEKTTPAFYGSAEDFYIHPERMKAVDKIAIKHKSKVYANKSGEKVKGVEIYNHANLYEAYNIPFDADVISGWVDKTGKFIPSLHMHKTEIRQALKQNKPVPREVLEEYKGESWAQQALRKPTKPKAKPGMEIYVDKVPPTDVPTKVALQNAVTQALNADYKKIRATKKKYKGLKNEKQLYDQQFSKRPELFIHPEDPIPEMRAAWTIAVKGKGLFGGTMKPGFVDVQPLLKVHKSIMNILEPSRAVELAYGKGPYATVIRGMHRGDVGRIEFNEADIETLASSLEALGEALSKYPKKALQNLMAARGKPAFEEAVLIKNQALRELAKEYPELVGFRKTITRISDFNYKYLQEVIGDAIHYVEDYFYGIYKDPDKVERFIDHWKTTKRFTKEKKLPTVADALSYGLELKDYNPINNLRAEYMAIARLDGMIYMRDELMRTGKGKYIDKREDAPIEWEKVHDPIFRDYLVAPEIARMINKLISTNKIHRYPLLNILRKVNNFLRTFKFMGSAFHQLSIAKQSLADEGYLKFVQPSATRGVTLGFRKNDPIFRTQGYRDYIEHGGGHRYSMASQAQQAFSRFVNNLNRSGRIALKAGVLPLRIPEKYVRWLFQSYIPKVKYAKYADRVTEREKKLGRQLTSPEKIDIIKEQQNFYGMMNERLFGRSGTATTFLRLWFMAPGYAEGNYRTILKSILQWGGKTGYKASRSRSNIVNSLLLSAIAATVGTLILTGKPPKKPETREDIRDLFKIDTGHKDEQDRQIMVDLLTYDKDYWNIVGQTLIGYPDKAIKSAIRRAGGMVAPTAQMIHDMAAIAQGKAIYDWKGDRVTEITDPFARQVLKVAIHEIKHTEPISVSVYKQSRKRKQTKVLAALTSLLGYRPTLTEKDRREQQVLHRIYSLKGQQEELYQYLATLRNPRRAVERYNKTVDTILSSPMVPQSMRNEWEPKLLIDLERYLENRAYYLSQQNRTPRQIERSRKILENFGITPDQAQEYLKKYWQRERKRVVSPIESHRVLGRTRKRKRLAERMQ